MAKHNPANERTKREYLLYLKDALGRDEATLDRLEANNQVLFRYCDAQGRVLPSANPNGAARGIAGICNETRNVFGMMPHPERACSEVLGNTDGRAIFRMLLGVEVPV